jgi:hypothetical protein
VVVIDSLFGQSLPFFTATVNVYVPPVAPTGTVELPSLHEIGAASDIAIGTEIKIACLRNSQLIRKKKNWLGVAFWGIFCYAGTASN